MLGSFSFRGDDDCLHRELGGGKRRRGRGACDEPPHLPDEQFPTAAEDDALRQLVCRSGEDDYSGGGCSRACKARVVTTITWRRMLHPALPDGGDDDYGT